MLPYIEIRREEDVAPAFETLKSGADALYVCPDALMNAKQARIDTLAQGARLPRSHGTPRAYRGRTGLMSYGAHLPDLFRRAGDLVDKI